ncbi:MAG: peptidoglycan D,D-transpeptidase FtsI family protein [Anaerolineae bacterium]
MQGTTTDQQLTTIKSRLSLVTAGLVLASVFLLLAIARLQQLSPAVRQEFELRSDNNTRSIRRLPAERGVIYDRDGVPLAFNVLQYGIGVSPNLVTQPERIAQELGIILNLDEFETYNLITQPVPWVLVARPVSADLGQQVVDLEEISITIDPLSRRAYPQGELAGPVIGFVIESNDNNTRGAIGIEANYNAELAGNPLDQTVSTIPFDIPETVENTSQRGRNIILTIDRDIQYAMEEELARGVERYRADGGVIIVMDPSNGEILAMAQNPTFDPNDFANQDADTLQNQAISYVIEPGSVMKVITAAIGLETGAITPDWTYNDAGSLEVGGVRIVNWDRNAYGVTDLRGLLVNSLNIGASTVALETGPDRFYAMMQDFGFGSPTRVDLTGEESGILRVPGDPNWNEADFASNAYGQAISVTPLQMLTAVVGIANDGLIHQPHLMRYIVDGEELREARPIINRVISTQTANIITDMMVSVVNEGATLAQVPGYSVAGKTGTAQISTPLGYESGIPGQTRASFVGFFPADDPQVAVYILLDRPRTSEFGSQTAAPMFSTVAQRLALLLGIPPDDVRLNLQVNSNPINNTP